MTGSRSNRSSKAIRQVKGLDSRMRNSLQIASHARSGSSPSPRMRATSRRMAQDAADLPAPRTSSEQRMSRAVWSCHRAPSRRPCVRCRSETSSHRSPRLPHRTRPIRAHAQARRVHAPRNLAVPCGDEQHPSQPARQDATVFRLRATRSRSVLERQPSHEPGEVERSSSLSCIANAMHHPVPRHDREEGRVASSSVRSHAEASASPDADPMNIAQVGLCGNCSTSESIATSPAVCKCPR